MAEHGRAGERDFTADDVQIGVADAARCHLEERLAGARSGHSDRQYLQLRLVPDENGRLHRDGNRDCIIRHVVHSELSVALNPSLPGLRMFCDVR